MNDAVKLWPTPRASDGEHGGPNQRDSKGNLALPGAVHHGTTKLWPTPRANDAEKSGNINPEDQRNGLPAAVKLWPTPTAGMMTVGDMEQARYAGNDPKRPTYREANKLWPTPNASDHRDRGNLSSPCIQRRIEIGKQVELSMCVSDKSGQLNPDWVESLMGFPIGWTDLECDEPEAHWIDQPRWPAGIGQEQHEWEPPRVAAGVKNRVPRLKACGNAVVPAQVFPILAAIKAVHDSEVI